MIAVHDVGANAALQGPRSNPFRSNGQWRFPVHHWVVVQPDSSAADKLTILKDLSA
jgi:hypothetical protein